MFRCFWIDYGLISFSNLCKFRLGFRAWIVFGMVFDSQSSIGIFYLVQSSVFINLKNLERIKFFLKLLGVVFLEEIFFSFKLRSVLLEKLLENRMWVILFLHLRVLLMIRLSFNFKSPSGSDPSMTRMEERIVEIKKWSKEVSSHLVFKYL